MVFTSCLCHRFVLSSDHSSTMSDVGAVVGFNPPSCIPIPDSRSFHPDTELLHPRGQQIHCESMAIRVTLGGKGMQIPRNAWISWLISGHEQVSHCLNVEARGGWGMNKIRVQLFGYWRTDLLGVLSIIIILESFGLLQVPAEERCKRTSGIFFFLQFKFLHAVGSVLHAFIIALAHLKMSHSISWGKIKDF